MSDKPSFLRRNLLCRFQLCGFAPRDNDTHLWGECTICGKKSGVISRQAVRRYIEAEEAYRESLARQGEPFNPEATIPRRFFGRVSS